MFLYFLVAILGSLSGAGAVMTLLAMSASFYSIDPEGVASSSIYTLYYLGIGVVGFAGGWIIQRFTAIILGITGSLLSASIVFCLACLSEIPPSLGLPAIFLVFLISGVDHPNSIRFFNEVVPENKKMTFFSIKEGAVYAFSLMAPPLAALIIRLWGAKICFFIDGCTYVLSCLPWIILKSRGPSKTELSDCLKPDFFIGFKLLWTNENIRLLNISRLLNNLSYVTWTTALPLLLAKAAQGNVDVFAQKQGFAISLVSMGFILASLFGAWAAKHSELMIKMIWGASLLGFGAVVLLVLSLFQNELLYFSAFFLGLGTYCFRISGITLGQAFTPKKALGAVIIAGDTLVRSWSFFVSLGAIAIFQVYEFLELSVALLGILIVIFSIFSLIAPYLIRNLARIFVLRNQIKKGHENASV